MRNMYKLIKDVNLNTTRIEDGEGKEQSIQPDRN